MTEALYALFAFVVMISVIVIVHEWGHYRSARMFGLVATHFSLGFGKKLFSWTDKRGTEWRVAPILLGGYVSFPGDDPKNPPKEGQKTLSSLKRWQKAIVVGAGPGINLVLSAAIFTFIAATWGYPVGRPEVLRVLPESAAQAAGIQQGDKIISINGRRIVVASDIGQQVILHAGETMPVVYERDGQRNTVDVTIGTKIIQDDDGANAKMGILGVETPKAWHRASNPIEALTQGVSDGLFMTQAQLITLKQVVTGKRSVMEMSGPLRIAKMSARTMSLGFMPFLYLMAMISIAVGVMNLLPIPGLDGGHLMGYAAETVLRRDIPEKVMERMAQVGFGVIAIIGIFAITIDLIILT